jgi:hypothetical protein
MVLLIKEKAIIVAFRRHTLLPLDACLYSLQATIPHLTRSSLHSCLQRHGISHLPEITGDREPRRKLKTYPIGYFHIDIAEVRTAGGKLYLYVAIDRTSKFAVVQPVTKTGRATASAFLVALIEAVPYKIHTVLTDNAIHFSFPPRYADGPKPQALDRNRPEPFHAHRPGDDRGGRRQVPRPSARACRSAPPVRPGAEPAPATSRQAGEDGACNRARARRLGS